MAAQPSRIGYTMSTTGQAQETTVAIKYPKLKQMGLTSRLQKGATYFNDYTDDESKLVSIEHQSNATWKTWIDNQFSTHKRSTRKEVPPPVAPQSKPDKKTIANIDAQKGASLTVNIRNLCNSWNTPMTEITAQQFIRFIINDVVLFMTATTDNNKDININFLEFFDIYKIYKFFEKPQDDNIISLSVWFGVDEAFKSIPEKEYDQLGAFEAFLMRLKKLDSTFVADKVPGLGKLFSLLISIVETKTQAFIAKEKMEDLIRTIQFINNQDTKSFLFMIERFAEYIQNGLKGQAPFRLNIYKLDIAVEDFANSNDKKASLCTLLVKMETDRLQEIISYCAQAVVEFKKAVTVNEGDITSHERTAQSHVNNANQIMQAFGKKIATTITTTGDDDMDFRQLPVAIDGMNSIMDTLNAWQKSLTFDKKNLKEAFGIAATSKLELGEMFNSLLNFFEKLGSEAKELALQLEEDKRKLALQLKNNQGIKPNQELVEAQTLTNEQFLEKTLTFMRRNGNLDEDDAETDDEDNWETDKLEKQLAAQSRATSMSQNPQFSKDSNSLNNSEKTKEFNASLANSIALRKARVLKHKNPTFYNQRSFTPSGNSNIGSEPPRTHTPRRKLYSNSVGKWRASNLPVLRLYKYTE
jgi:hypothetical protein